METTIEEYVDIAQSNAIFRAQIVDRRISELESQVKALTDLIPSTTKKKKKEKKSNHSVEHKFCLHEDELVEMTEFTKRHISCGFVVYDCELVVTGIGNILTITCPGCKNSKEITGVDSW